jgi:ribosome recycling factor
MSSIPQILKDVRAAMDKAVESAKREFSSIHAGKATASMLDTVRVEVYGQQMPINQVASVSTPEARLLVVTPWDKGNMKAIEKAIRESGLGFDPAIQGPLIRVPMPGMNEQRRRDLAKIIHKMGEDGKIAVRHARTDGRDRLKKLEKIPEDDVKHAEKDLQKLHDDHIAKIDDMIKGKEAEIMEV